MKTFLLILGFIAWSVSLVAQTTREQADTAVREYLKKKGYRPKRCMLM